MSECAKLGREKSCLTECAYAGEERQCPLYERPGELKVVYIPVDRIDHHPDNPRKNIGDVTELAASIRNEGIRQPLTLVPHIDDIPERYTAVIGHRRLEAAKAAGLTEVPAILTQMEREEQLVAMMTENGQRVDLTPVEQADGFQMILDLPGQSVATVAKKTGFSETTVRRRLKLREFDREKLEQADSRGATMADYEKLNAIKSPERRNRALGYIGTTEFARQVQVAQTEEANEAWMEKIAEKLSKNGCKPMSPAERGDRRGKIEMVTVFYIWNKEERTSGYVKDAEQIPYYYVKDTDGVYLYRERIETPQKTSTKTEQLEALQKKAKEELESISLELESMNQEFRDLREDFLSGFGTFERNREEIIQFAVKAMLWASGIDKEELADWLNIHYSETDVMDQAEFDRVLRMCPEKVLLYVAYLKLEDGHRSYTNLRQWNYETQAYVPERKADKQLDRLYECLRLLGYQWSTDEQRASVGDLDQYGQARQIVEDFKAKEKELGE